MRPKIFAHRGARAVAPENTIPAFLKAVELGADGIELDVLLSLDGIPIVIHDTTIDKTTDGTGYVDQMTVRELKKRDSGSYFDPSFAGTRIPTLYEVLESVPQEVILNIELKGMAVDKLPQAIHSVLGDRHENIIFSSFNTLMLDTLSVVMPSMPRALLTIEGTRYGQWQRNDISAWHPYHEGLTADEVEQAHADGLAINVWTVNEVDDIRRMTQLGVDGIITDYPDVALEVIAND